VLFSATALCRSSSLYARSGRTVKIARGGLGSGERQALLERWGWSRRSNPLPWSLNLRVRQHLRYECVTTKEEKSTGRMLPGRSAPPPTFSRSLRILRLRTPRFRPLFEPLTSPLAEITSHASSTCPSSREGSQTHPADRESSAGHSALLLMLSNTTPGKNSRGGQVHFQRRYTRRSPPTSVRTTSARGLRLKQDRPVIVPLSAEECRQFWQSFPHLRRCCTGRADAPRRLALLRGLGLETGRRATALTGDARSAASEQERPLLRCPDILECPGTLSAHEGH